METSKISVLEWAGAVSSRVDLEGYSAETHLLVRSIVPKDAGIVRSTRTVFVNSLDRCTGKCIPKQCLYCFRKFSCLACEPGSSK